MKSKSTAIWFLIAAILASAIWFVNQFVRPGPPRPQPVFAGLRADHVTRLQIIPAGAREISVVRTNHTWLLDQPFSYPAQASAIDGLLDALTKLMPTVSLSAADMSGKKDADAEFGFDNPQFTPENTDVARIRGVELQGHLNSRQWSANLTGTWLDPRNRTPGSPNYGKLLPRRPRVTGRLELARQWPWTLRSALRINASGRSYDDAGNTSPLGGYTTLDALIQYSPAKQWTLQAKVGNLTDRRYQTALYYPQDGRNYLFTVRYAP